MGEYYVTGSFNDLSLNFYNSTGGIDASLNKTDSSQDIYLAKYNSNGTFSWARQIGGILVNTPVSIVTDNTDVYVTGSFNDLSLNFYNSTGGIDVSLNKTDSYQDTFIAKYNSNGTFSWAKQIGGTFDAVTTGNLDDQPVSIVTDNTNVYITGHFRSRPLNFYNSTGGIDASLNKTDSSQDTFIAKYELNGTFSWVIQIRGGSFDVPVSIVTSNTDVYITGYSRSAILDFYNSSRNIVISLVTDPTARNIFIAKCDPYGTFLWAKRIEGSGFETPVSIVTANTDIYLTGYFDSSSLKFYNSIGGIDASLNKNVSVVEDETNSFIVKYESDGTFSWAKQIGGTGLDQSVSIVTDNIDVYITGYFNSPYLFFYNSSGDIDMSLNNIVSDDTNTYIAKYESDGTFSWAKQIGGTGLDQPVSIVTANTDVYITGYFDSPYLFFYNSSGDIDMSLNNSLSNNTNTYLAKYESDGTFSWAKQIEGPLNDYPTSLVTDNTNIYISGYFNSPNLFFSNSNETDIYLNNTGNINTYIAKCDSYGTVLWARQIGGTISNQPLSACVTIIEIESPNIETPISNICFLGGTPVLTDQGIIEIQDITNENTINNIKVKFITQTTTNNEYLVCIEKDAIFENVPSQRTVITRNHKIFYNGYLVNAESIPNTAMIQYNGEKLYNVLLEENGLMLINNMICETLDINNVIAKLYDHSNKNEITNTLNSIINTGNMELYKKTAIELLS